MPTKEAKPVFVLTITPEGPCQTDEAFRRLRAALKALLRSYGMRCRAVEQVGIGVVTPDSVNLLESNQ